MDGTTSNDEPRMQTRPMYVRFTEPNGKVRVEERQVWDAAIFYDSLKEQYEQPPKNATTAERAHLKPTKVTIVTKDEYDKYRFGARSS